MIPFNWTEFETEFEDPTQHIPFTPVPRLRARRRGWSGGGGQRAFADSSVSANICEDWCSQSDRLATVNICEDSQVPKLPGTQNPIREFHGRRARAGTLGEMTC